MVFRGTFEYTIDNRGRIPIPARYRATFSNGAVLTKSQDGCVEVYTADSFEGEAEFLLRQRATRKKARRIRRGFFGGSLDVDLDGQGRILLPPWLRQHGNLNGSVLVVGRGECLEIWNPERWAAEQEEVEKEYEVDLESMEERP
jgi:transcriptional regulator MraZ